MKNCNMKLICLALIVCVAVSCQAEDAIKYVNNQDLKGDNLKVQGNNNEIVGDSAVVSGGNNKVTGNNAKVDGSNVKVIGNNAIVDGSNAEVVGDNSIVIGNNALIRNGVKSSRVKGNNAEVYSKNANVDGNNAKIQGDDAIVRGNNADVIGDRANITGKNPTVTGNEALICSDVGNNIHVTGDDVVIRVVYKYSDGRKSVHDTDPNYFDNEVEINGARASIVNSAHHCEGLFGSNGYDYDMGITGKNLVVKVGNEVVSGKTVVMQRNTIDFTGKYSKSSSVGVKSGSFTLVAAMCAFLAAGFGY